MAVKKASSAKLERLHKAKVVNKKMMKSAADLKAIEALSDSEVRSLIAIRRRRGAPKAGRDHMRPNIVL